MWTESVMTGREIDKGSFVRRSQFAMDDRWEGQRRGLQVWKFFWMKVSWAQSCWSRSSRIWPSDWKSSWLRSSSLRFSRSKAAFPRRNPFGQSPGRVPIWLRHTTLISFWVISSCIRRLKSGLRDWRCPLLPPLSLEKQGHHSAQRAK